MKVTRILITAAIAALMASPVLAADSMSKSAPAPAKAEMAKTDGVKAGGKGGRWAMIDANNDGAISKEEWNAAQGKKFDEIDTNHDGNISKEEWAAKGRQIHAMRMRHAKGSTSTPAASNQAAPSPAAPASGADGAGGATAQ